MATVDELSGPYGQFMLNPLAPTSADVCRVCLTFTDGYPTCYHGDVALVHFTRQTEALGHQVESADAVLPISYSVHFGQLHDALAQYKRAPTPTARPLRMQLAAVLWRFLADHEACLARAVGCAQFDLVTTVPSGDQVRDEAHPLPDIVGRIVQPTAHRYQRILFRSGTPVASRRIDPGKFNPSVDLAGESVLLIDDTWTTGASIQSAAAALKNAGAGRVAALVIGRHVNEDFGDNSSRLKALARPFDWTTCALQ